ncbi:RpiB/LacA/LacB family sugar-phosphate isomerase [Chromobacterium haemolyticum]|uniref:RpiB/LacA/LacB family sugar-phosphate isomerase n=1 Tax=Chromobacterium fluminis TaxID=3044269 RepID=A0ABX0LHR1_9NEIS|nr:RpiB/LacA/LacB family sugar-phosphate isomerase [Chromobacterium haemolyticum]NHR06812.1 RpiB/LacA/LacB family sugar-phosphate isomerase [Chromobacterium haemolyticum]
MHIAIACDEAAFDLKEILLRHLQAQGRQVSDCGVFNRQPALYADIAIPVAEQLIAGRYSHAVLLCGTGIGMAIAANKVAGIRAAQCHDTYSAERAKRSNDAQIITLGARVVGPELAKRIVDTWLEARFDGGASQPKLDRIHQYEQASPHRDGDGEPS